eukprot:1717285-Pleurochrysis_carterae.AAC.1
MDEEEFLPQIGAYATTGGLETALRVWQSCIELNEQLHTYFDDRSSAGERERMGALNEAKGKAWAMAMRSHTGVRPR